VQTNDARSRIDVLAALRLGGEANSASSEPGAGFVRDDSLAAESSSDDDEIVFDDSSDEIDDAAFESHDSTVSPHASAERIVFVWFFKK